ncbi:MAG: peptide-methionine (S)-S-oxide reductase MsrA [Campylobacterota bacterium]|nr:peptide-methionine (S)-S-oxide reductase MsrA [Campylobacterota bacterium]
MIVEIVFAAGCFWGVEKHFEQLPGVVEVKSGYVGGNYDNPTYGQVLNYRYLKQTNDKNIINHTEAVKVKFDNRKITANDLIKDFWELHNPTQKNAQGNDVGNNYRSALFYTNDNQHDLAIKTKNRYQSLLAQNGYGKIVTQIEPLRKFWDAENYHQDYLAKNPNGYCPNHSTGVKFEKQEAVQTEFIMPLKGKEIVVIKSDNCPYCEKFEQEVSSVYKGSMSMRTVYAKQLKGFDIQTKLFATPTIVFIEDGKEIFAHRGAVSNAQFYKMLGDFKLGKDSESYNVAFNQGTDNRYCKQYEIFKNTPDGVFVDKLSGDVLFDTNDRFNSKSGWLSFYKAVDGATIQKPDNSYGMKRVEVIAKKSGIHLGHVFPRVDGRQRFCINATVLDFVPR